MKRKYLILLVAVIVVGAFVAWKFLLNDAEEVSNVETPQVSETQQQTEEEANQTNEEPEKPDDEEQTPTDEPKQSNSQLPTSQEKPTVSTGSGHSGNDPLPRERLTSTICTASVGSKCKIQFINASTGKVVEFIEKEIQNDGSASWDWKGSDVGSGTWNVYAVSGTKKSDKEVIYIQ